jgi:multiple sugar transport system permease protein
VKNELRTALNNSLFLVPLFLVFLLIILYPFGYVIFLSFFRESLSGALSFVGFQNYLRLFQSEYFPEVLMNTLVWTFGGVLFKVGGGLVLALVLYRNFRYKQLFLLIILVPWAIPFSISHITWTWMYNALYGHINSILMQLNLMSEPFGWLSSSKFSLLGVLIANSWTGIPFCAFSILSGLYAIPNHLFESADINGASGLQKFRYITFPLITPVLSLVSALTAIWTFNNFGAVWLMTKGGPVRSSTTLIVDIYRNAFEFNRPGYANAVSVIAAILLILLTSFYVLIKRQEELV